MVVCYYGGMKNMQTSKKRIAFPIQLKFDESVNLAMVPNEIHVVPTGKWDHPAYGEMEIGSKDIQEFIKNFKDKVRRDIPITAGHDNGMSGGELPAVGWITDLFDRGIKGLYATMKWTDEGVRLLREGAYKYFSPEFYTEYEDPETREKYSNVLVGGALTNKPYFKELDAVVLSFSEPTIINQFNENNSMDLKEILAKDLATLTAEEKAFVKSKEAELSDEEKETLKDVLTSSDDAGADADGSGDDAGADDKGADKDAEGAEKKEEKPIEASEKKPKGRFMSEAEIRALEDKANNGQKAFDEVESMRLEKTFSKMVFSDSNQEGRFAPKQQTSVVSFMKSLSEKQRDQFTTIINAMPKAANIFSEVGDGGGADKTVASQLEAKVQEKIKASEGTLKYADAVKLVFKENPDLTKEYEESIV